MTSTPETDLTISRLIQAPRTFVWAAWADPGLLQEWWCPRPWVTEVQGFDLRAGGTFDTLMHGPNGEESPNQGVFLEVVPFERIVFSSILTTDWRPVASPFIPMTAIITLVDAKSGTDYTARVLHPDAATCEQHREMGFHEGWGICIAQLEEVAQRLARQ